MGIKVVSSTLRPQTVLEAPSNITVVEENEIQARGYRTLKELLVNQAGFSDLQDVNEEIGAIRGTAASTSNKTLILLNGHRMNDHLLGRYNLDQFFDMNLVKQVEFIKGPGSAIYGTGALNGVINIILKSGSDLKGALAKVVAGPYSTQLSTSYGFVGDDYTALLGFSFLDATGQQVAKSASYDVVPSAGTPRAGNIYHGRYPGNWSLLGNVLWKNSSLLFQMDQFQRVAPLLARGGTYDYGSEIHIPRYTIGNFLIDYSYTFTLSQTSSLTVRPSFHQYLTYEQSFANWGIDDDNGGTETSPVGTRSGISAQEQQAGLRATYENQIAPPLNLIFGANLLYVNYLRYEGLTIETAGSDTYEISSANLPLTKAFWYGLFGQAVWDILPSLSATVGGRFDGFKDVKDFSAFNPRFGLVYDVTPELTAKLLYGESILAPARFQLINSDPSFVADPNLQPEKFRSADFIVRYDSKDKFQVSASFFYNSATNFINAVSKVYTNADSANFFGGDLESKVRLGRAVALNASYSLLLPDLRSTSSSQLVNNRIKHIPTHTLLYGVEVSPLQNLTLAFFARTYLEIATTDNTSGTTVPVQIPVINVANLTAMYRLMPTLTFQLIARNLLNAEYDIPGFVARPVTRPGLNVEGGVTYRF
jgi:outer membrane receptor protein involved in Fe transport